MKKIISLSRIILGAGLLMLTLNSCKNEPKKEDPKEVAEDANDEKFDNDAVEDDAQYLTDAAEILLSEIEIGKLGLAKSSNPEVKKFAQALVTDHTKALEELNALANKKTISIPTTITEEGREEYNKLDKYTSAEFDKKFIDLTTDDHEKAVDKMTEIAQKATDSDIKTWSSRQITLMLEHHEIVKKLGEIK